MSFGIPVRNGLALGLTPSTTLASGRIGGRPALLLNFISTTALPSTITFSRGSNATLTDSTGKITYAPNNLLTNSESFEAAAWSKSIVTITANAAVAPDGTTTADVCTPDATNSAHSFFQSATVAGANIQSIYVKPNGYTKVALRESQTGAYYATFNLTGSGSVLDFSGATATITAISNGWYRIAIAGTIVGTTRFSLYVLDPSYTVGSPLTAWTPNGTSGVFIWGAQLEQVTYQTTPSTYNSTTPKNLLGYTQEFDNAAWTKSNSFVQTNLFAYSQRIGDAAAWGTNATTATINSAVAPDGTTTASTLTADGTSNIHRIQQTYTGTTATQTFSFYAKAGTNNFTQLYLSNDSQAFANFDLAAGVVGTKGTAVSASSITSVGGGWYRCVAVITSGVSSTAAYIVVTSSASAVRGETNTLSTSILLWGAQLVQGATAGDYQPTYAAAAAVQYAAPDGTLSADKLVETATNTTHRTFGSVTTTAVSYAYSVYLKAAERTWAYLRIDRNGGTNPQAWFDLSNGAVGTVQTGLTASIQSVGNGWYRCAVIVDAAVAGTANPLVGVATANAVDTYTGDGTSGIYVWGAQLSNSASLDPYVYNPAAAPTSAAYYGPRFDYDPVTLAPKGLLIEEQRSNLLTYSQQFDNAVWTKGGATVTANSTTSPDGTVNADTLTEDTSTGDHRTFQTVTVSNATAYAFSVFIKPNGRSLVTLTFAGVGDATYNVLTGVVTNTGSGTAEIQNAGNGWYRCILRFTTATTSYNAQIRLVSTGTTTSYTGNGTSGVFLWGAQVEAGAFATSYIPTVASTVTRSADVAAMLGTNFSSWYNQTEGTVVASFDTFAPVSANPLVFSLNDNTTSNRIDIFNGGSAPTYTRAYVATGGVAQAQMDTAPAITSGKAAIAYAANNFAACVAGATVITDTSGTVPTVNQLQLGRITNAIWLNGHIRTLSYYNTRLTNTQLQALTA